MILYNTTFHIEKSIEPEFLSWLKDCYIPQTMKYGFANPMLARISLPSDDESDSVSAFALHVYADNNQLIDRWTESVMTGILHDMFMKWGERALAFATPMELIDLD